MKILGSFDTKLDEREFYDAIQKYGEGNAILMKKHRIFLVLRAMIRMLFSFVAFSALIWITYKQFFNTNQFIFRTISIIYFIVTFSRCVHSLLMIRYDIKQQMVLNFGFSESIHNDDLKEGKYELFLRHTIISGILQILLLIGNCIISIIFGGDGRGRLYATGGVIVNIIFLFCLYRVLYKIIDYEMDFNIFTMDQFIIYRQHGFFKTESMNIATSTIKIVKEGKSNIWGSLFHYGNVSLHPEGSLGETKSIELFYVPNPRHLTKKLNEFIEKSKEGMNVSLV